MSTSVSGSTTPQPSGGGGGTTGALSKANSSTNLDLNLDEPAESSPSPLTRRLSMRKGMSLQPGQKSSDLNASKQSASTAPAPVAPMANQFNYPFSLNAMYPTASSSFAGPSNASMGGASASAVASPPLQGSPSFAYASSSAAAVVAIGNDPSIQTTAPENSGVGARSNAGSPPPQQPPSSPPVAAQQSAGSNLFTFLNTQPLQTTITNLIKALVTLSEQSKTLRNEFQTHVSNFEQHQQYSADSVAGLERRSREEYANKKLVAEQRYDDQKKVEKLIVQVAAQEESSLKDRQMIHARLDALERAVVNAASHAEWARTNCAPTSEVKSGFSSLQQLISNLGDEVETQRESFKNSFETIGKNRQQFAEALDKRVTGIVEEQESLRQQHLHHEDVFKNFVHQSSVESVARDEQLALTTKDLERVSNQTSMKISSIMKTCNAAIDQRVEELGNKQLAELQKYDTRLNSVMSLNEVHNGNMSEQVFQLRQDVAETKSELSAVNSILNHLEGSSSESAAGLTEKLKALEATNVAIEEKQGLIRERLQSLDRQFETKSFSILDQVEERVAQLRVDMEKSMRSFFVSRLTEQQSQLVETITSQFNDVVTKTTDAKIVDVDSKIETVSDSFTATIKQLRETFQEKLNRVATATHLTQEVLGINPASVPTNSSGSSGAQPHQHSEENHRAMVRYVKSLPWYPRNGMQTPTQGGAATSASSVQTPVSHHPQPLLNPEVTPPAGSRGSPKRGDGASPPTRQIRLNSPTRTSNTSPGTPKSNGSGSSQLSTPRGLQANVPGPHFGLGIAEVKRLEHQEEGGLPEDTTGPTAEPGVIVTTVARNGPAYSSGLRVGDVLLSLHGKTINSRDDFLDALLSCNELKRGMNVAIQFKKFGNTIFNTSSASTGAGGVNGAPSNDEHRERSSIVEGKMLVV